MSSLKESYYRITNNPTVTTSFSATLLKLGRIYTINDTSINITALGQSNIGIETGPHPVVLLVTSIGGSSSHLQVDLRKDVEFSGGTSANVINNNQLSDRLSESKVHNGVSVSDEGDLIYSIASRGVEGSGGRTDLSKSDQSNIMVLKPSSKYLIRVSELSNSISEYDLSYTFSETFNTNEETSPPPGGEIIDVPGVVDLDVGLIPQNVEKSYSLNYTAIAFSTSVEITSTGSSNVQLDLTLGGQTYNGQNLIAGEKLIVTYGTQQEGANELIIKPTSADANISLVEIKGGT